MSLPNPLDKYIIQKRDGTPLDPKAKYFVVRFDALAKHGSIGRSALRLYCILMLEKEPALAEALKAAIDEALAEAIDQEGESNG